MIIEADIASEKVNELQKIIDSYLRKEKEYLSEIDILNEQIRCLKDKLFGRKSEKKPVDDKQLSLFDLPEEDFPIVEESEEDDEIVVPEHKRKKRGRKPIPEDLPRIEVIHDIDEAEKLCKCGCLKTCIGEEVSEQLDIVPSKIQVIRNVRPKYACKKCEGVESDGPTVAIARLPEQIIPKCIGTPGLIAFVITAKFVDALPFYRQEKQFLRIGVKISRATM
ncbi:transposase (IS66 family protein) [Desulforapulum autotrophicum HRM2]|uniref:Transposase (IS66 family protein) n=1 Tax=Desulforapulum autotrophicum (strain ATCC 43914 / DSM 3382 / VKM B-1955 / HRM2) TaxID=177437 RepID=C0QBK8_DESAH